MRHVDRYALFCSWPYHTPMFAITASPSLMPFAILSSKFLLAEPRWPCVAAAAQTLLLGLRPFGRIRIAPPPRAAPARGRECPRTAASCRRRRRLAALVTREVARWPARASRRNVFSQPPIRGVFVCETVHMSSRLWVAAAGELETARPSIGCFDAVSRRPTPSTIDAWSNLRQRIPFCLLNAIKRRRASAERRRTL